MSVCMYICIYVCMFVCVCLIMALHIRKLNEMELDFNFLIVTVFPKSLATFSYFLDGMI